VCEGRQLKAKQTGKLARLEEQEQRVISSNTLRISKRRGQEDSNDANDSNTKHNETKKAPYGSNYRPLVLPEKIIQTGDKVQPPIDNNKQIENEVTESKKSKKNKKRKLSEIESKEDLPSTQNNKAETKKQQNNNKLASNNGFFFFNYDNENEKLNNETARISQPVSIVELYSDGTERKSKSAKRKAKKQRTK